MNKFLKENWFRVAVVLVLIFIGIAIFNMNTENPRSSLSEVSFEKREQCANNRAKAKIQLEETYSLSTPFFYDIFYSSKVDSCVYTYGLLLLGESPNEMGSFVIADYFAGETLFSVDYDNSSENSQEWSTEKRPIFSEEVEKYRN